MKIKYTLLILAVLMAALTTMASPLKFPGESTAKVGIYIEDLSNGNIIAEVNADELFLPASVMKSVTSATAISVFDPSGRFITPVVAVGTIKNGVLDGDLVIRTLGDPSLESCHFPAACGLSDSIVAGFRRLGIKTITGNVVVDASRFVDDTTPRGWLDRDLVSAYGTTAHAVNYRDNLFVLNLPDKSTTPHVPAESFSHVEGGKSFNISRRHGEDKYTMRGSMPSKKQSHKLPNPNPGISLKHDVAKALDAAGIKVEGKKESSKKLLEFNIHTHRSPRVDEILHSLMVRSDNMMAEGMLRAICDGRSREDAINYEKNFWISRGVNFDNIKIYDGSGLSRDDRVSPRFLASIYRSMYNTPSRITYSDLFPRAGVNGTMRNFMKDTRLKGRLALKTGSVNNVQTFGGYLVNDSGVPTHIVVVLVNDFKCDRDKVKSAIADYLLEVLP